MAGYIRQSVFTTGDDITAALFNDEYNQLVAYSHALTGHKHDGTTAEGAVITMIGDTGIATPYNKILVDTGNNNLGFWVDVSSVSVEQITIADGVMAPVTDNDIDLGTASLEFKDGYFDGTLYTDALDLAGVGITFIDEDSMASASATNFYSGESLKAYVDAQVGASNGLTEILTIDNTTGGLDLNVDSGDSITGAGAINITGTAATGALTVTGVVTTDNVYKVTGANYGAGSERWIGTNAGTGVQINTPTGATTGFTINNSGGMVLSSTGLNINGDVEADTATITGVVTTTSVYKVTGANYGGAGERWIGTNAGTGLQLNTPTGATIGLTINNSGGATLSASSFSLASGISQTLTAGDLTLSAGDLTVNGVGAGAGTILNSTGGRGAGIYYQASGTLVGYAGVAGVIKGSSDTTNMAIWADGSGDIELMSRGSSTAKLTVDTGVSISTDLTLSEGKVSITDTANETALAVTSSVTTGDAFSVSSTTVTSGSLARFYSNSSDAGGNSLVEIINDHTSASSMRCLWVQQDAARHAVYVDMNGNAQSLILDSEATTANIFQVDTNTLTTGKAVFLDGADALTTGILYFGSSNSADVSTRSLMYLENENTLATGCTVATIRQDAAQRALFIDQNANGVAVEIATSATTADAVTISGAATTGAYLYLYDSGGNNFSGGNGMLRVRSDGAASTGILGLFQNDGTGTNVFIDQNGNGQSIEIDSESTSAKVLNIESVTTTGYDFYINSNSLTTGGLARFYSASSATDTRNLVEVWNDNPSSAGATALSVRQDAAQNALYIDQNGNSAAISIDSEATSADGIVIDMQALAGGAALYARSNSITTGRLGWFYSDSASTGTRNLVEIHNDNTAATGTHVLHLIQDGARANLFLDTNADTQSIYIDSEAAAADTILVYSPQTTSAIVANFNLCDQLTTGSIIRAHSNSASTGTRNLVEIVNDNAAATGATVLSLVNDASGTVLDITPSTNEKIAINIVKGKMVMADGFIQLTNTVATYGINIAQNVDSHGLWIDSTATTASAIFCAAPTAGAIIVAQNEHASTPLGISVAFTGSAPNDATQYFLSCADTSATRMAVRSNGGIANFQSNDADLSDQRVKTELVPLESTWDKTKAIEVGSYRYLDQNEGSPDNIGVIAQQVLEVAPELVEVPEDEDELLRVFNKDLYFTMLKALQEAQARIEALEAKV